MGTPKLFTKNKLNPIHGATIETESLRLWKKTTEEMSLKSLIELKIETVERVKNLSNSLAGILPDKWEIIKNTLNKIEALQYNLTIFKQLNAIANVGDTSNNFLGINACIYQSSDLKALNLILKLNAKKASEDKTNKALLNIKEKLEDRIAFNNTIISNHYRIQQEYNKKIKVIVEYLLVK